MSRTLFGTAALAFATLSSVVATTPADARRHHSRQTTYYGKSCRHSSGTTGLIAGGVGGALVGRSVIGGGILGTAAGAVGGALAGRAIERSITAPRRCYRRR